MIAIALVLLICGIVMNVTVIYMNDGYMPVAPEYSFTPSKKHKAADKNTKLVLLIDRIYIPRWNNPNKTTRWVARNINYPLTPAIASVGDLFIWAALLLIHLLATITILVYVPLKIVSRYHTSTRQ